MNANKNLNVYVIRCLSGLGMSVYALRLWSPTYGADANLKTIKTYDNLLHVYLMHSHVLTVALRSKVPTSGT